MRGLLLREWLQFLHALGRGGMIRLAVIYGLLMGWLIPSGLAAGSSDAPAIVFAVIPVFLAGPLSIDAFAGERDRMTLETLLSSPVGDGQLLAAKALFPVLVSLGASALSCLVFCSVSLARGTGLPSGGSLFYAVVLGLALTSLATAIGLHISLRARTSRSAQQWYSAVLVGLSVGLPLLARELLEALGPAASRALYGLFEGGWLSPGALAPAFALMAAGAAGMAAVKRRMAGMRILNSGTFAGRYAGGEGGAPCQTER